MQDGAVEVKKEPLERSEAREDPKAVVEILVGIRRPRLIIESIVKTREAGPKKFEESDIELFVEAVFEDADEETVVDSIIEAILEAVEGVEIGRNKIAGGGAVLDKTAGGVVAISNKAGERDEAIRVAIERS